MVRAARVAVVLMLIFLAGCGGKKGQLDKVVARAGDIEVTLGDFSDAWTKITPQNRPDVSTLDGKRKFANDLVNQRILLAEAKRLGGVTDPQVLRLLEQRRRADALAALYHDEIQAKVEVQGADVEELYKRRGTNIRASHILLEDVETAKRVRAEIESGAISFEDAARKYTLDQSTRAAGGSLGEILWATTLPAFQEPAFAQEPGVISQPIETHFGVHLLRVDERVTKQLPSLEEMRPGLRADVGRQKEQLRLREFSAELEQKAQFTWNEEGVRTLRAAIDEMTKRDPDSVAAEDRSVPPADEERRKVVLATFSGRNWTIGDYVDLIRQQPESIRPPGAIPVVGLKEFIRTSQIDPELAFAEAQARKIDARPEVKTGVQRLEEQVLIETLHGRFLQTVDITPEEVRSFFDSTRAVDSTTFLMPERVDMVVIANPDSSKVRDALTRIARGASETDVIPSVSLDMRSASRGGRTGPIPAGTYPPPVEEVAFAKGRVGKGWSPLIRTEALVYAVKVLSHDDSRAANFDEVQPKLTQQLAQARGEKTFEDWLKKDRETRGVEIFDDALELYGQAVTGPAKEATAGSPQGT